MWRNKEERDMNGNTEKRETYKKEGKDQGKKDRKIYLRHRFKKSVCVDGGQNIENGRKRKKE